MRSESIASAVTAKERVPSFAAVMKRYGVWLPHLYMLFCAALATIGYGSGNIIGEGAADLHVAPVRFIRSLAFTWDSRMYLGNHNGFTQVYSTPYSWLYALGELLHANPELVQRIVLFSIYAWIIWAAYFALKHIAPGISVFGRLCCASAYLFNIYVGFDSNGAVAMLLTYASTPVIVGILAAVMNGEWSVLAGAVGIAAAVFFGSGNNPPLIAINLVVAVCYLVVRLALANDRLNQLRRAAAITVAASVTTILLNLYWIVPFMDYIRTVWLPGLLDESPAMHNLDSSFSHVLLGFGQWGIFQSDIAGPWYAWAHAYTGGLFVFAFWMITILAFATPLFRRARTSATAFFFTIAVISVPFAVGYYSGPIGPAITSKIYDFFYNGVPGFQMFRSAYKWVWPYEFAVAGLFGIFADNLYLATRERLQRGLVRSKSSRALLLAYGVLGLVLLLPAIAYLPIVVFKANYAMNPVPSWILEEGRVAGTDQNSRVALFPSQYLEQFIWGRPWYYLEHGIFAKPVIFGYLGGASNESADEWLRFAYQRVREGDPSALAAFKTLSVSTVLQRDDFRSDIDFAFPTLGVSANTTLSHDMISRILHGTEYARLGASRFYHVNGALPIVYGVEHARISDGPAVSVAQSSDLEALANGGAVVTADRVPVSAIRDALADGLVGSRNVSSIRSLSATSMYRTSPHLEIQRPGQSVRIPATGWYRVLAVKKDPSQDQPLGSIRVDDKKLSPASNVARNWSYYGARYLRAGAHAVDADTAGYVTPILVVFVPQREWLQRVDELSSLLRHATGDSFTVPVLDKSATINVAAAGTYRIHAQPLTVLTAGPRSEYVGSAQASAVQIDTRQIRSGSTPNLAVPYAPADGVVPTQLRPLSESWYAQAQTYDWNRGAAVTWWMLTPRATFMVYGPSTKPSAGAMHIRLSDVGPRSHRLSIFAGTRRLRDVQLSPGTDVGAGSSAALAAYLSDPVDVTVPMTLQPGMNEITIVSDDSRGAPTGRISDAMPGARGDVVAAIAPDMAFTVNSPQAKNMHFAQMLRASVSHVPTATRVSLARQPASSGFALVALPVTSQSLDGDPFLIGGLHASLPENSHAWISEMVCDDVHGGTQYRTWPLAAGDTALNLALAQSLVNSSSDGTSRLCGLWLALSRDRAALRNSAVPSVLVGQLSMLRWLWPETSLGVVPLPAPAALAASGEHAPVKRDGKDLAFSYRRGLDAAELHIPITKRIPALRHASWVQFVAEAYGLKAAMSLEGRTAMGWQLAGITIPLTVPAITRDVNGDARYRYDFSSDARFATGDDLRKPSRYQVVVDGHVFKECCLTSRLPDPGEFRCEFEPSSGALDAIDITMPRGVTPQRVEFVEVPALWAGDYGTQKVLSFPRLALQDSRNRFSALRLVVSIDPQQDSSQVRSIVLSPPRLLGEIGHGGMRRVPLLVDGKPIRDVVRLSRGIHHVESALPYEEIATLTAESAGSPAVRVVTLHADRTSPVSLDVRTDRAVAPFLLVFGESYHPHWKAFLNGRELTHIEADGFANGWIVPGLHPGEQITVRFTAQRWFVLATSISILAGAAFLGFLAVTYRRSRRRSAQSLDGASS
ncbi:MAG: hypothetical protein ACXVA3_15910 [Vulcanimicrobiaceae bacterium]